MSDEKKAKGRKAIPATTEEKSDLTPQQTLFIAELIKQGFQRAGPAYMIAYPKSKKSSADANASYLLKNHKVRACIEKHLNQVLEEKKAFLKHEIFNFWYVRMTYDPTEIIDLKGQLVMELSELRRRGLHVVIDSINRKLNAQGTPYMEYKLADRDRAAERLDGYIHMTTPQPTLNLNLNKDMETMTPDEEALYRENIRAVFPEIDSKKE